MLSSGCDVRECRVLLPKGVPNGKHHSFHPDRNSHSFHPDVSQSPFYQDDFPPSRIFHIRRLTPDGRGGRFKFPSQTYSDPLIALTRRASAADISDYPDFCTVPQCSLEASRYLPPTKLDFFSQDILCKFLFSPCNQ